MWIPTLFLPSTESATKVLVSFTAAFKSNISSGGFGGQQGPFILSPASEDRWRRRDSSTSRRRRVTVVVLPALHTRPTSLHKLFTERDSESEYRSFSLSLICRFHLHWDKLKVLKIGKPQETLIIWFTFSSANLGGFSLSPAQQTTRQPHTKGKGRGCYGKSI